MELTCPSAFFSFQHVFTPVLMEIVALVICLIWLETEILFNA